LSNTSSRVTSPRPTSTASQTAAAMSSDELAPPLTLSATPSYSTLPLDNERRLEYTPRRWESDVDEEQIGTYTRGWRSATIALSAQAADVMLPVYDRAGLVAGELCLKERTGVHRIILTRSIQLEGLMTTALTNNGKTETVVARRQDVVWDALGSADSGGAVCPGAIPFAVQFPRTYVDGDRRRALPPTFQATFLAVPMLTATCAYRLRVTVARGRKRIGTLIAGGERSKVYDLALVYRPRSRPHRPLANRMPFLSSLKSQPDEWLQITKSMGARGDKRLPSLCCSLFVPSVQVFCIEDAIPLHLQVSGPASSFREFMPSIHHSAGDREPDRDTDTIVTSSAPPTRSATHSLQHTSTHPSFHVALRMDHRPKQSAEDLAPARPSIRVSIMRQVYAEVNGTKTWRMLTLGIGKVSPLSPPPYESLCASDGLIAADCEGEVRCEDSVSAAGFSNGHLSVVVSPCKLISADKATKNA
ncbi:hypothetical protein HDZ31DRAFT_44545, partial [Schizophyllum fasciatum]